MAIPFFASCNKADKIDDKINSQEELEKALLFKDVTLLRAEYIRNGKSIGYEEFSPNVYYYINADEEIYVEKANDTYYAYEFDFARGWTKTETVSSEFETIADMVSYNNFDEMYEKFKYEEYEYKNGMYTVSRETEERLLTINVKFENKKMVYWQTLIDEKDTNISYEKFSGAFTYNIKAPVPPEVK